MNNAFLTIWRGLTHADKVWKYYIVFQHILKFLFLVFANFLGSNGRYSELCGCFSCHY